MGLLRLCFVRTQTWLQAGKYVSALASDLPSRNGWSVAEHAGDRTPGKAAAAAEPGLQGTATAGVKKAHWTTAYLPGRNKRMALTCIRRNH
jgi:hypothetical protein